MFGIWDRLLELGLGIIYVKMLYINQMILEQKTGPEQNPESLIGKKTKRWLRLFSTGDGAGV